MKLFLLPALGAALLAALPSSAQTYPGKPVRFVVPYAAGGPVDTVARLTAQKLTTQRLTEVGAEIVAAGPAELTAYTRSESALFGKLIAAGIPKE